MDLKDFESSPAGRCIMSPRRQWAFMPEPLPPAIDYEKKMLVRLLAEADGWLAKLSETGKNSPDPSIIVNPFIRREAVSSSRIDGMKVSLSDLFVFEATGSRMATALDAREVHNYVCAFEYGIKQLKKCLSRSGWHANSTQF